MERIRRVRLASPRDFDHLRSAATLEFLGHSRLAVQHTQQHRSLAVQASGRLTHRPVDLFQALPDQFAQVRGISSSQSNCALAALNPRLEPLRILRGDLNQPHPTAGVPHSTAMRPEHVKQYHLYDGDRVIATGQAALDYPWRPGLILRWLMPPEPKRRRISPEARYRGRRRRLQRRLQRQAPLFAAQLEQQILADRPEYYGLPKP